MTKYINVTDLLEYLEATISEMEQVEIPRWIPVTEAVPTDPNALVLCCVNGEFGRIKLDHAIMLATYDKRDKVPWFLEEHPLLEEHEFEVLAWMPLPEPYKEETE